MKKIKYEVVLISNKGDDVDVHLIDTFFSSGHAAMFKRGLEKGLNIGTNLSLELSKKLINNKARIEIKEVESEQR